MNIPPVAPSDLEVLELVQREWTAAADHSTYLPVGFGAHHWRIDADGAPILFATLDSTSEHRSADSFELAYSSANALKVSEFVGIVTPIRSASGKYTHPLANGLLSVTPWVDGVNPSPADARNPRHVARVTALIQSLHDCDPPETLPRWGRKVPYDFHEELHRRVQQPWTNGPLGETARQLIQAALDVVGDSLREYHALAGVALAAINRWVVTHSEPHWANQMLVNNELVLIDWETVSLAPPEIDFVDLPWSARTELGADEDLVRMFRLEWQLTEIAEYADWFENEHTGSPDDHDAIAKLKRELRPI